MSDNHMPVTTLSEKAFSLLKSMVINCKIRPGSIVTEQELSNLTKLGKAPIRAAIARLSQEGFFQPIDRRGILVRPVTIKDVNEIFDARLMIEVNVAKFLALNNPDLLERLRLDDYCRAIEPDDGSDYLDRFVRDNRQFHIEITSLVQNGQLNNLTSGIYDEVDLLFHLGRPTIHAIWRIQEEQNVLCRAIASGTVSDFASLLRAEIDIEKQMLIDALLTRSNLLDVNIADL